MRILAVVESLIEQIVADAEERAFPGGTAREAELAWLPGKVDAVIGMRRSGKTWLLQQSLRARIDAGMPRESVLYVSLEDERLAGLRADQLGLFVEVFYRRRPSLRERECIFVFDEIQVVEGWEPLVRRLLDTENVRICISGSSSKLLSQELATSMRGRSISTELFPFSFAEYLLHHGVDPPRQSRPGSKQRSVIEHHLRSYLVLGGFPEVQGLEAHLHRRVLQEYLDVVLLRDVVERHAIGNVVALRRLMRQLLGAPAGLFSIHRLYNDLRSQGVSVGKDSLHAFLDHLHDAFLFFPLSIHTDSERVRQTNPRKIYPVDPGLVTAGAPQSGWGTGQLLETLCFLHLRRMHSDLAYYRHEDGTEVDFVVKTPEGPEALALVQVSADVTSGDTRSRELRALDAAMSHFGARQATLVTLSAEETVAVPSGEVRIVPFALWSLGAL